MSNPQSNHQNENGGSPSPPGGDTSSEAPGNQPDVITAADHLRSSSSRGGRLSTLEKLTLEQYEEFLEYVRLGVFDHTAAASLGVTPATYAAWLRKGRKATRGIYHKFFVDVIQARGHAKVMAEVRVKDESPLSWLRMGPGKGDWTDDKNVNITGRIEHDGEIEHKHELRAISRRVFAETLLAAEEQGYLRLTDLGRQTLLPPPEESEVVDVEIVGEGDDGDGKLVT